MAKKQNKKIVKVVVEQEPKPITQVMAEAKVEALVVPTVDDFKADEAFCKKATEMYGRSVNLSPARQANVLAALSKK